MAAQRAGKESHLKTERGVASSHVKCYREVVTSRTLFSFHDLCPKHSELRVRVVLRSAECSIPSQ